MKNSENQHLSHYSDDYAGIDANWNPWIAQVATIFSTQVSYAIGQKYATGFLAIQKFTQSCPYYQFFFDKILIEREVQKNSTPLIILMIMLT